MRGGGGTGLIPRNLEYKELTQDNTGRAVYSLCCDLITAAAAVEERGKSGQLRWETPVIKWSISKIKTSASSSLSAGEAESCLKILSFWSRKRCCLSQGASRAAASVTEAGPGTGRRSSGSDQARSVRRTRRHQSSRLAVKTGRDWRYQLVTILPRLMIHPTGQSDDELSWWCHHANDNGLRK